MRLFNEISIFEAFDNIGNSILFGTTLSLNKIINPIGSCVCKFPIRSHII